MTPVYGYLVLSGWHGASATRVLVVGLTPRRFRIRAITRTRLAGRGRYLEPGAETLVPLTAVRIAAEALPDASVVAHDAGSEGGTP